jgi:uncharacterized damage-inducible protein DinB
MKHMIGCIAALIIGTAASSARAQPAKKRAPSAPATSIAAVMESQLRLLESQFVPAVEAMPESGYAFVPEHGEFNGVRTFGLQVKHVATAQVIFYSAILGRPLPPGVTTAGAANGPDEIQSKGQIVKYLKDSFALGHEALATLTARTAMVPLTDPPIRSMSTPLALATWSCAHAWDHYGQMVAYLRLNGIVPPASVGQPPANPRASGRQPAS